MGLCSPGLVEQKGSSYRWGNVPTAACQGSARKYSLGFQWCKVTKLNGHSVGHVCEMFCFPILKQPVFSLQGGCAPWLMFALSATVILVELIFFHLGSSLMAAHRHPVGFEFSVEMGIFQTAFLDFKEKKISTKQNHPILGDPAPAFGCAVSALFCSAAE